MSVLPIAADMPPAGTRCFTCSYLHSHFCAATAWWFEVPVCASCLAGQTCPQRAAVDRMLRNTQLVWDPVDWRAA